MVGATILICIIAVWILSPPIAVGHTVIGIITYIVVKILFAIEKSIFEKEQRRKREEERKIKEEQQKKEEEEREKKRFEQLVKKYGPDATDKILSGEIWLGAPFDAVIDSWGEPHYVVEKPRTYCLFYDKQRVRYRNYVTVSNVTGQVTSFSSSRRQ